jgi:hypothetical protein
MKKFREFINEEGVSAGIGGGPTNSVGSGAIAGVGVGKDGEPGVNKNQRKVGVVLTPTPLTRK